VPQTIGQMTSTWAPTPVQTTALSSNSVPISSTTLANQWAASSSTSNNQISNELGTTTIPITTSVSPQRPSTVAQIAITSTIIPSLITTHSLGMPFTMAQSLEQDQTSATTDKYAFKGRIVCAVVGLYARFQSMMKFCYENCSSPDRVCPTDKCYCVWLP
jgi:hypothetical protein